MKALISIWGDDKVQRELDGAVRNKQIYTSISRKMMKLGYERDWQQCKTKVKNLKGEYRKIKDHNGQTGKGRKTCRFYTELDRILGARPASVPCHTIDTSASGSNPPEEKTIGMCILISVHHNYNDKRQMIVKL